MVGTRLITWTPSQTPSTSYLPTLDPDGLYAASILQAKGVTEYSISAPSSLLHSRVPCLEETATGVILAQDISSIERFARKHSDSEPSLLDDEEVDIDNSVDNQARRRRWAQRKALERHNLIYATPVDLSSPLFTRAIFASYSEGISIWSICFESWLIDRSSSE